MKNNKKNKMVKNVFLLMSLTMLSKFIGFFRELVMGYCYGASMHSDAYFTAYDIPQVLFSVIATAIATTFIPLYYKAKEERGEEGAVYFTNNIMSITMVLGIIISVFAFIFMEKLVNIIAYGFEGELLRETVMFARVMLLGYIFSGFSSIMSAYLQSNENFFIPGIIGIPFNIVIIVGMISSVVFDNIYILPIGASLGLLSQFLVQVPKAIQLGYRPRFKLDLKDKYIKEMFILVLPVLVSVSVSQLNKVVDKTLASTLEIGSLSSLNYSNKLIGFFIGLFITTISIVIYPQLAELSNKTDKTEFNSLIVKSMNVVFLMIVPITMGCVVLAEPIVEVLFMRGAFDQRAVSLTSNALLFYSIGMIGLATRTVVTKIYYSIGDTTTPMTNSTIAVVINIALSFILVRYMQNGGIALATSASYLISSVMLVINLKKKVGDYGVDIVKKTLIKAGLSAAIMAAVVKLSYDFSQTVVGTGRIYGFISLALSVFIGIIVYFIMSKLMKISEIELLSKSIMAKVKRRKNDV